MNPLFPKKPNQQSNDIKISLQLSYYSINSTCQKIVIFAFELVEKNEA